MVSEIMNLIRSIKTLNVPRIEDLPYWSSPPVQFVFESTANLALGQYTWDDSPTLFTNNRPLLPNVLYYFRHITLAADIEELDFTSNIATTPDFYTSLETDARGPLFREPIRMVKYFDQFTYRLAWKRNQDDNKMFGAFKGVINQGTNLIGKSSITLKAVISAQEIVDESFINLFSTHPYPHGAEYYG